MSGKNKLPPILVDLSKEAAIIDSHGISKHAGHLEQRTLCLQRFTELFGMQLKVSDMAIVRSPIDGKKLIPLKEAFRPRNGRPWGSDKAFKHNRTVVATVA